jgi:hypothetical protein
MTDTPGHSGQAVGTSDDIYGSPGQQADDAVDTPVNITIIWFLGLALLGIIGALIGLSVSKTTFPEGLTTLASLIVGGLLGVVNPTRAIRQRPAQGSGRRTLRSPAAASSQKSPEPPSQPDQQH